MIARFAALLGLGAVLFVGRMAVEWPQRLIVVVAPGEDVDEAILIDQGIRGGWYWTDPVIRDQLAKAMRFAGETGSDIELVRRADELGLVETDPLVRARLLERARAQVERVDAPTREQLEAYLRAQPERYQSGPIYGLWVQGQLPAGLPRYPRGTPEQLASRFGDDFARRVTDLTVGEERVLTSPYGEHMVYLEWVVPPGQISLDEVGDRVEQDWKEARRELIAERRMAELRARYRVIER